MIHKRNILTYTYKNVILEIVKCAVTVLRRHVFLKGLHQARRPLMQVSQRALRRASTTLNLYPAKPTLKTGHQQTPGWLRLSKFNNPTKSTCYAFYEVNKCIEKMQP